MKRWTMLIGASLITLAGVTEARAFDPAQYQAVKSGQTDCPMCDLSGANLTNANLTGVDLWAADFTDADLAKADLTNANLAGALLMRANLKGAILTGANFTGARLDQTDLTGAILTGANLEKAWCNYGTKLPAGSGWSCGGVIMQRE